MPETIKINEEAGIIEVKSYGIVLNKEIEETVAKIHQIFDEKNIYKVLVDTTQQDKIPDIVGLYSIVSNFPRQFRLALLIDDLQTTAKDVTFAETVGVNRGICVKIFSQRKQALMWLKDHLSDATE